MNALKKIYRKIIERLSKGIIDEKLAAIVINLDEKGFEPEYIAKFTNVSVDFVKKTLSE